MWPRQFDGLIKAEFVWTRCVPDGKLKPDTAFHGSQFVRTSGCIVVVGKAQCGLVCKCTYAAVYECLQVGADY